HPLPRSSSSKPRSLNSTVETIEILRVHPRAHIIDSQMNRTLTLAAWLFPCVLIAGGLPHYEVDSSWPKPLPKDWHTGLIGGVCTDSHDHVLVLNRHMPVDEDYKAVKQ